MRRAATIALALAMATPARADDPATAEALFQEGRRLVADGNYAEACPKFEESLHHDRAVGTLWHLARCLEETGAIASAWARYREAAAEARKTDEDARERAALHRAKALEPRLPRLTIDVPVEHRVDGLTVTRDGTAIGPGVWGTPLPVDPGTHVIEAAAPGYQPWQREAVVDEEGARIDVTVPELHATPPDPVGPVGASLDGAITREREPAPEWYEDRLGWALAGGGVAIAVGGVLSMSHADALEDDANAAGDLERRDELLDNSKTYRDLGTGLVIVGTGVVAAGVIKLVLVPDSQGGTIAAVRVDSGEFGVAISGTF